MKKKILVLASLLMFVVAGTSVSFAQKNGNKKATTECCVNCNCPENKNCPKDCPKGCVKANNGECPAVKDCPRAKGDCSKAKDCPRGKRANCPRK